MTKYFFIMKTNNLLKTLMFAIMALIFVGITSCNDDDPVKPTNETEDKGHEDWAKVTFTFRLGHLHGSNFHGNPINKDAKYFRNLQEVTFEYDSKGNLQTPTDPVRLIKDEYYALEITYYNKKGERMNSTFTTPEMAPIHQHFFLTKDAKDLNSDKPFENAGNIITEYTYRDTDPENKMYTKYDETVKLRGKKDPIGLKGYFKVSEKYAKFNLNVILVHIGKGTKLDKNGNPYPYNEPNLIFLSSQDLNVKIPIRVYAERPEDYSDKFFEDAANEFNITVEEAIADYKLLYDADFESGKYWM